MVNATNGGGSLAALEAVGVANLSRKVIIDVANPLDFSQGRPPILSVCNTDSLGEQIQRAYPEARVVKTLNTMNAYVMVDPARVPGRHDVSSPVTISPRRRRSRVCLASSGGAKSRSSTSAASGRHAAQRCICRSGSRSGVRSAPATSTSPSPGSSGSRRPSAQRSFQGASARGEVVVGAGAGLSASCRAAAGRIGAWPWCGWWGGGAGLGGGAGGRAGRGCECRLGGAALPRRRASFACLGGPARRCLADGGFPLA